MKLLRGGLKCLFWVLIIVLMLTPLFLIYEISSEEMKQYLPPEIPILKEMSVGTVVKAERKDVREYITVSGIITSTTYEYIEVDYAVAQNARWFVSVGDEIQIEDCLASGTSGEIVSTVAGIINEMHIYSENDCYIKVLLFSPIELKCNVSNTSLSLLKRSSNLCTIDNEPATLTFASQQKNGDGTTTVRISFNTNTLTFGEVVESLQIYTGRVFWDAIVLPAGCVYQNTGGDQWYVRKVSEGGYFLGEIPVTIGYSDGSYVCVTGIEEGDFFDSGYKFLTED